MRTSPTNRSTSGVWSAVTTGRYHTCATTTGRSLYCWGFNATGGLGDGTTTQRPTPKKIGASGVWNRSRRRRS